MYNIYSSANKANIFAGLMEPSSTPVSFQTYIWDSLELHIYQTNQLIKDIGADQIEQTLFFLRSTIPNPLPNKIDYFYGDPRELLSLAQSNLVQLRTFCRTSTNVGSSGCQDSNLPFPLGFPNYFHPIDIGVQLLGLYGISGDITVSTIDHKPDSETTGQVIQTSVITTNASRLGRPAVQYCSVLPKTLYDIQYPAFISFYKAYMNSITANCPTTGSVTTRSRATRLQRRRILQTSNESSQTVASRVTTISSASDFGLVSRLQSSQAVTTAWSGVTSIQIDAAIDNNPLKLSFKNSDLGIDPYGYWRCYGGPNDYSRNPQCYRPKAQSMFNQYSSQPAYGFQGPVFAAIDTQYSYPGFDSLELRVSITDSMPSCEGPNNIPTGVRLVSFHGFLRFVVYSSRLSTFRAWICGFPDSLPRNYSILNMSNELELLGLLSLEPGPVMELELNLTRPLTIVHQALLQESICTVVWDRVDDLCLWRMWTTISEMTFGNQTIWKLIVKSIYKSNSNAARANFLVTKLVNSGAFRNQFPLKELAYFPTIISPHSNLSRDTIFGCTSHYDCAEGLFCSLTALRIWSSDYRGGGAICDECRYCISDDIDPIDKWCPRDKCGAGTGGYPSCINASKLLKDFSCQNSYNIDLSLIPDYESKLSAIANNIERKASKAQNTLTKARFLTPFNQIVGAISLTQRRINGTCIYKDDKFGKFYSNKDPERGQICRGNTVDSRPYGYDPAFLSSSSIYDGTLDEKDFYTNFRINPYSQQLVPYGFFPHSYDGKNRSIKLPNSTIAAEANLFKLFFDERLSSTQAQRLLTYIQSGAFIDSETDTLSVEIITLNAEYNMFAYSSFIFTWQPTGKISWDYIIRSVPAYLYPDENLAGRVLLEVICVGCLAFNSLLELKDIFDSVRKFKFYGYLLSSWNLIDWAHFSIMWLAWFFWLRQYLLTASLPLEPAYPILVSPEATTKARAFLTDSVVEFKYLQFSSSVNLLMDNMATYSTLTSLSVILFVLRLLKTLDFQPKMALITRTLRNTVTDLNHFFILFTIVWMGYTIAGNILYGHLFIDFSTLAKGATALIIILINWDPSATIVQELHASSEWMYSLFLWSWILLAYYILLNIFLAILVEGYIAVKRESEAKGASGIMFELYLILKHEFQKLVRIMIPQYPFVSDEEICDRISQRLRQTRSSSVVRIHRVLSDFHKISLSSIYQISLGSGDGVNLEALYKILKDLKLLREDHDAYSESKYLTNQTNSEKYVHAALSDIMIRYGTPVLPDELETRNEQNKSFMEAAKLDAIKRVAQLHFDALKQSIDKVAQNGSSQQNQRFILTVHVEKARHLPKMDIARGVDVFCALFVEGYPQLYQTEILRGLSESEWTWGPDVKFQWDLGTITAAKDFERNIVIMVYDKDQVSSDDLIGCVSINLGEVIHMKLDDWREIVRPQQIFFRKSKAQAKIKPELKIKALLESFDICPTAMQTYGKDDEANHLETGGDYDLQKGYFRKDLGCGPRI